MSEPSKFRLPQKGVWRVLIETLKVGLFLGGLAWFFLFLQQHNRVRYENGAKGNLNVMLETNEMIHTISLGNSHARHAISIPHLGKGESLQLGADAQDLFETATKMRALPAMFPNLDTVLVSLSYFSFHYDNGNYTGPGDRNGKRIAMYTEYDNAVPVDGDLVNFIKGRGYGVITRDHQEKTVEEWLAEDGDTDSDTASATEEPDTETDTGDGLVEAQKARGFNPCVFTGRELAIPNQRYLPLGGGLTLVGFDLPKEEVFSCGRVSLTWYVHVGAPQDRDTSLHICVAGENGCEPIPSSMPCTRLHPYAEWEEGQLIHWQQSLFVPVDWTEDRIEIQLVRESPGTEPDGTFSRPTGEETGWPAVQVHYPNTRLPLKSAMTAEERKMANHACSRAEAYVPVIENMLENHPSVTEDAYGEMRDAIEELQAKGIRVVLYTTPYHYTYNMLYPHKWQQQATKLSQELSRETGAPYHDFSNHHAYINAPTLFKNSDHLNPKGKVQFTLLLNKHLEPLPKIKRQREARRKRHEAEKKKQEAQKKTREGRQRKREADHRKR